MLVILGALCVTLILLHTWSEHRNSLPPTSDVDATHKLGKVADKVVATGTSCGDGMCVAVVTCGPEVMVSEAWNETSIRFKDNVRLDFHHENFEF